VDPNTILSSPKSYDIKPPDKVLKQPLVLPKCNQFESTAESYIIRSDGNTYTLVDPHVTIDQRQTHIALIAENYSILQTSHLTNSVTNLSHIEHITDHITRQRNIVAFIQRLDQLAQLYGKGSGERIAETTAEGFKFTDQMLSRDADLIRQTGSIRSVIVNNFKQIKQTHLSGSAVSSLIPATDPEYNKLFDMAENGVTIPKDPSFKPNNIPPPLRELQRRIPHTFAKHVHKLWDKQRVLVVRYKDIPENERHLLNFASFHWRFEPKKPLGRLLIDLSNSDCPDHMPLNGGTAKELAIAEYSKIVHPTICEMISSWIQYMRKYNLIWKQCYLSTDDVEQAFPRLNYTPDTALLMCAVVEDPTGSLDDKIINIYVTGCMGGTATCGQFEVVARPLSRKIQSDVSSVHNRYVDDLNLFGTKEHIEKDKPILQKYTKQLLGPDAISEVKDSYSQAEDILAWHINLAAGTIRLKEKAIGKLTFVLFLFDYDKSLPLQYWQCLTSLVYYYAKGIRGMEAFISPISKMIHLASTGQRRAIAKPQTKFAIFMWRAALYQLFLDKDSLTIPIDLFYQRYKEINTAVATNTLPTNSTNLRITTDAGTDQIGLGIYNNNTDELIIWTSYLLPFPKLSNKDHHTYYEYLGYVLAQILVVLCFYDIDIIKILTFLWETDNTAAMVWSTTNACSSQSSQMACMASNWIQINYNIHMFEPKFRAGNTMGDIDAISRRHSHSLGKDKYLHIQDDIIIQEIFKLFDPYVFTSHIQDQLLAYRKVHAALVALKSRTTHYRTLYNNLRK